MESVFARYELSPIHKETHFLFIGLKEKYFVNTNPFVKQADSIAARDSCIFLGVLLRDYFGSYHAVKIQIQKYVTFCSILLLACYF